MIKGAVSDLVHFVNNANCASLLATELEKLLVKDKITAPC